MSQNGLVLESPFPRDVITWVVAAEKLVRAQTDEERNALALTWFQSNLSIDCRTFALIAQYLLPQSDTDFAAVQAAHLVAGTDRNAWRTIFEQARHGTVLRQVAYTRHQQAGQVMATS